MIRKTIFSLFLLICLGLIISTASGAPTTIGQPFVFNEKLLASDRQGSAEFGTAVALSRDGQRLVVGARLHDVGGSSNQGRAYVFRRNVNDTWTQLQTLTAPDGSANDEFGTAVAISSGPDYTIVVGAPPSAGGTGSAYVYEYNGGSWDGGTKLTISDADPDNNDRRGTAVAITDDASSIFVGAPGGGSGNPARGAVFVLVASGSNWIHDETLSQSTSGRASMGKNLLVNNDGDLLFVAGLAAPSGPVLDHGAVHIYQKSGTWNYDEMLLASDTSSNNEFGLGMAISNDENILLIGAPGKNEGQVYALSPGGGTWTENAILTKPNGPIYSKFGQSLALDSAGTAAVVGAWLNGSGGIYYYERSGGSNWQFKQTLNTTDGRQEHLGYDVAMSGNGDMVIGGARSAHSGTPFDSVGAVYTYVPGYQVFLPTTIR